MNLVDSSVWVDYFNGTPTPETDLLDEFLGSGPVAITDLILAEVLQGFRRNQDYRTAKRLLGNLVLFESVGVQRAVRRAEKYRMPGKRGVAVRKTADALIASFCIDEQIPLLFSDRDFRPFVQHLGLVSVLDLQ